MNNNFEAFFALVRAGLWEKEVRLLQFEQIAFNEIYRLAEEQSVIGLVAAGLEHVIDIKAPQGIVLQFVGTALQLEQHNTAMNKFIGEMLDKMKGACDESVLIKGQGVAQCYKRPLWRSAGDVDLLLDKDDYERAKSFLTPLGTEQSIKEKDVTLEYCLSIGQWAVELHGTLNCRLSKTMDNFLAIIQDECCNKGRVRVWNNNGQNINLPSADNDVIIIFTHFVKHFFRGGIGLRQICDWCRLLWTYRDSIDKRLLWSRIKEMGIETEWKAFAAFAVEYLGMPSDEMPFYEPGIRWKRKARSICKDILKEGNFGHNRDYSYYEKYPRLVYKAISLWGHFRDAVRHSIIFPIDSWRVFFKDFSYSVEVAMQGK